MNRTGAAIRGELILCISIFFFAPTDTVSGQSGEGVSVRSELFAATPAESYLRYLQTKFGELYAL